MVVEDDHVLAGDGVEQTLRIQLLPLLVVQHDFEQRVVGMERFGIVGEEPFDDAETHVARLFARQRVSDLAEKLKFGGLGLEEWRVHLNETNLVFVLLEIACDFLLSIAWNVRDFLFLHGVVKNTRL